METIDFYPLPFLVGLGLLFVLLTILRRKQRRAAFLLCFSAFWLYLLLVVNATLFPIPLPDGLAFRQPAAYILSHVNLVPLDFGGLFSLHPNVILHELVGNILLTIPLGFGLNFITRYRARHALGLAVAAGLAIETAQLGVSLVVGGRYRGVDINDVLLNAAGVMIGYGLFWVFAWLYRTVTDRLGGAHTGLLAYIYEAAQKPEWRRGVRR